jgi:hypothetical protein
MPAQGLAVGVGNNPKRMNYKQIRDNIVTKDRDNILSIIFLFIVYIAAYHYFLHGLFPRLINILIFTGFLISMPFVIRRFYSDWTGAKDVIGNIKITSDRINSEKYNKEILISEITSLELRQNFIKGKRYRLRDIIHNGLAELKVKLKNGEDLKLVFLVENKEQFEYLGTTLKEYYRKKIDIKETMFNSELRTILLKPHWHFKDLQNLKNELNIDFK